jgi:hypothetical protein
LHKLEVFHCFLVLPLPLINGCFLGRRGGQDDSCSRTAPTNAWVKRWCAAASRGSVVCLCKKSMRRKNVLREKHCVKVEKGLSRAWLSVEIDKTHEGRRVQINSLLLGDRAARAE